MRRPPTPRRRSTALTGLLTCALLDAACLAGSGAPPPSQDAVARVDATPPEAAPAPGHGADGPASPAAPPASDGAPSPSAPDPAPPLEPISAGEATRLLDEARASMSAMGTSRSPRTSFRGHDPTGGELRRAYDEGRAMGYTGRIEQARLWMARAKFGTDVPTDPAARGPLAHLDLWVTTPETNRTDHAWLHVVVPEHGPRGELGRHGQLDREGAWVHLGDHASAGRDYVPFKRNGKLDLNKQWGRAEVIEDLAQILAAYHERTGVPAGVGDISEVTGGKIKDHWTHRVGMDADVYVLDYPDRQGAELGQPQVVWHHRRRGKTIWSTQAEGKGERYPADEGGENVVSRQLRVLAEVVLEHDDVHVFIHDASTVLAPFDERARERREGRRYLHLDNHGYWPRHPDHVHLRWTAEDGPLPFEAAPRP